MPTTYNQLDHEIATAKVRLYRLLLAAFKERGVLSDTDTALSFHLMKDAAIQSRLDEEPNDKH